MIRRMACPTRFRIRTAAMSVALCGLGLAVAQPLGAAPPQSIESRAEDIAKTFNAEHATTLIEGPTLAVRAVAQGKQVLYTHTVKREPPFTPDTIERFKAEFDAVMLGVACTGHAKDDAFKNGLSYTTVFQDEKGERLHALTIDRAACERI